jgi:periplasmic divalent cation tolerance protein
MFATVFVTVPSEELAASIGADLVEKKMAACANFFPCRSIYRWKGMIENDDEWILLLKIRSSDFHLVAESIVSMHPYDVPCIVKEEFIEGYPPCFDWLKESTERS